MRTSTTSAPPGSATPTATSTPPEFDQADRQELDDAVLELLGVVDGKKRAELRSRLYAHLQDYFEAVRRKEERGIDNKVRAKKNAKVTPQSIAADVFAQIESQRAVLLKGYRDLVSQAGAVAVVASAYGWLAGRADGQIRERLFKLNQARAALQ